MNAEDLKKSLLEYSQQVSLINEALKAAKDDEKESLLSLQNDLNQLINLTEESLNTLEQKDKNGTSNNPETKEIDDEYALFMQEMEKSGAYDNTNKEKEIAGCSQNDDSTDDLKVNDIEDELATLLGMKCAVYHTHKWGGQPTLHNAMVSAVVPREEHDQFNDLQVRVLFTHPTHSEMLPCPFFLDGECRFNDEQCRFSHGSIVQLSKLEEAIEPNFENIKVGSHVLLKLKPPDGEDISLTKKSSEKYHLWHRAVVKNVDMDNKMCYVRFEHGVQAGDKRKSSSEEIPVHFENLFPLNNDDLNQGTDSEDSLSDTEYPEYKTSRTESIQPTIDDHQSSVSGVSMGEWERHTRGIGSKLMLAMGYVPGTGLGSAAEGRVQPVEARIIPKGKSLDHCMAETEQHGKTTVEQKLMRLKKKEEARSKKLYENAQEREKRNVFNFLNKTLGNKEPEATSSITTEDIKKSTSKDLNIEQFKITEESRRIERDIIKLNNSLSRHTEGTPGFRNIQSQLSEKSKELNILKGKELKITKEQNHRKDKQKMTIF